MDKYFAETKEAYLAVLRVDGEIWDQYRGGVVSRVLSPNICLPICLPIRTAIGRVMYSVYPQMIFRTY